MNNHDCKCDYVTEWFALNYEGPFARVCDEFHIVDYITEDEHRFACETVPDLMSVDHYDITCARCLQAEVTRLNRLIKRILRENPSLDVEDEPF